MPPHATTNTVTLHLDKDPIQPIKPITIDSTSAAEGIHSAETEAPRRSHNAKDSRDHEREDPVSISADYVRSLERRLVALESKLNDHNSAADKSDDERATITKASKAEASKEKETKKASPEKNTPAVVKDGLYQKPEILRLDPGEWRIGKKVPRESDCALVVATEGYTGPSKYQEEPASYGKPLRLLLNSQALRKILTQITDANFANGRNVLTRPFRYLLIYEREIKERLHRLQQEAESEKQPSAGALDEPADSMITSAQDNATQGPVDKAARLAAQMGCLVDFMENDMKEIFAVREQIRKRTIKSIHFEDLWMLFKPGDVVVSTNNSNDNPRQAYRVLHVTGGRRILDVTNRSNFEPNKKWRWWHRSNWTPEEDGEEMLYNQTRYSSLAIDCFYLDSDGRKLGARSKRFVIGEFSGEVPIASLDVAPLDFFTEAQSIRKELICRGKLFESLMSKMRARYQGVTMRDPFTGCNEKDQINSEVVLDQASAIDHFSKELYPIWSFGFDQGVVRNRTEPDKREVFEPKNCGHVMCSDCTDIVDDNALDTERRMKWIHSNSTDLLRYIHHPAAHDLSEDRLILLPAKMYGYALLHRRWYPLAIEHIETEYKTQASTSFADLVLPKGHEQMIRALVKNQVEKQGSLPKVDNVESLRSRSRQADVSMDVVRGKGQGLTILLHGVPGVGKTSTAECIAAELKRPLFPVTCGDLGSQLNGSESVEVKLNGYFMLAHKWKCVLLLDEADVFLAKREKGGDLNRNALVSIFLRVLEYYPGVLILTTNRVGEFDEAFKSRIHVSLHYPKLKEESTAQIWESHIRRLKDNDLGVDLDEVAIRKFYKRFWADNVKAKKPSRQWNGRQIKNAFQTAIALANWTFHDEADGSKLKRPLVEAKHFRLVQKTGAQFDDYISKVYHVDDDKDVHAVIAQREELRNDELSSETSESEYGRHRYGRHRGPESKKKPRRRTKQPKSEDVSEEDDDPETRHLEIQVELRKLKKKKHPSEEEEVRIFRLERELKKLAKPSAKRRADSDKDDRDEDDTDDEDEGGRWGSK